MSQPWVENLRITPQEVAGLKALLRDPWWLMIPLIHNAGYFSWGGAAALGGSPLDCHDHGGIWVFPKIGVGPPNHPFL